MSETTSILVVDDNQANTDSLADILELKGFLVYVAASGAQALQILHEQPVDILLTDVKMPGMNGLELFRETRQLYPNLTTIFMTAYSADELIQQGRMEGIKAILDKSLDIHFLLTLLRSLKRINSIAQ
jgi:CheY-like chemotaxis protein